MNASPTLIAGGGIAGLAAALGLARVGRPSRVFERQSAFAEVGAGLQMSPNGVRALRWLGAWEAVEPFCIAPPEILVRSGGGGVLQRIQLGAAFERRFGAPYRVVHRGDLLAGLVAACRRHAGIDLNLARQAVAAGKEGLSFESGDPAEGTLILACDGIHSRLRLQKWPETTARYRGHALYRALLPMADVPGGVDAGNVTLWLHRHGHVVHYPVSGGRYLNIVATIDSAWRSEAWSEPGKFADLEAIFGSAHRELTDLIAGPPRWLRWAGADLPPPERWTAPGFALMGDAAHATLPYLAQGAVMSLEDACVLAQALSQTAEPDAALAHYEAARRPRCTRIQLQSRKQGKIYHAAGLTAGIRNMALRLMTGETFLDRNAWIYNWQPPI